MKFLFLGDIHIDKYKNLIDEKINILKLYLDNDIENVIIPGDIFDSNKGGNTDAVYKLQNLFSEYNKTFYLIIGNHDIYYKNKIKPNSIETSFKNIKNCVIIDKPTEIDDILMVPWITDDNHIECEEASKKSNKSYCVGHFAFSDFYVVNGVKYRGGLKPSTFKKFKRVISNHFHIRQTINNISYLGNITQDSWNDFDNQKGYHILDTSNDSFEFILGSKQIYKHLVLDDSESDFEISDYKDCHIKLFHKEKLSKKQYEKVEELKEIVCSYKIEDQSIELVESKIEKIEFSETLVEFLESQEMKDDYKKSVEEYILIKYREVG